MAKSTAPSTPHGNWPADRVERWLLSDLIPYARNARTHSDEQISQLAASIREWGWTMPILADEQGSVVAGHGRVLAAERLGLTEVPVMVARGWTDAQVRAYRLADNKLALNANWDYEMLRLELPALADSKFDLALTGFRQDELEQLFTTKAKAEDEWQGMPEFNQPNTEAWRTVRVHFKDAPALAEFAKLVRQKIHPDTKFIWFPEVKHVTEAEHYAAADEAQADLGI